DSAYLLWRAARSAVTVVRVLDTDQAGGRHVDVGGTQRLSHLVGRQKAPRRLDGPHLEVADHRRTGHLVVEDVRVQVENDFLAGLRMADDGEEVAHGAGRDEEPGGLPEPLGRQRLEPLDGRILLLDVVTDGCVRNALAHTGR